MTTLAGRLKADWISLAQVAVWISAPILLFVLTPPRIGAEAAATGFIHLSQFLIAVSTGLLVVGTRRRANPADIRGLGIGAVGLIVVAVVLFFAYWVLMGQWTCDYDGRGASVIGKTLLPDAQAYLKADPTLGCTRLIQDYAGAADAIWPRHELVARQTILGAMFVGMVVSFAMAALLVLEAMRRASPRQEVTS